MERLIFGIFLLHQSLFVHVLCNKLISQVTCQPNVLNVSCSIDSVIYLHSAEYGRMHQSTCLSDAEKMGCKAEVLGILDAKCSGRHSCSFEVPGKELFAARQCGDLLSFLETTHECIKVATGDWQQYQQLRHVTLTKVSGYISSAVTEDTSLYGLVGCPWRIEGRPGQKINLTLIDFSWSLYNRNHGQWRPEMCKMPVKIREMEEEKREIPVCESHGRNGSLYTSKGHILEIEIKERDKREVHGYFLIKYTIYGCPDFDPPPFSWVRRHGGTAIIRCNFTQDFWHLICQQSAWVGKLGNCSKAPNWAAGTLFSQEDMFPYGVLLVVAIGVALGIFCGGLLLGLAIFFMKRRQRRRELIRLQSEAELVLQGRHADLAKYHITWNPEEAVYSRSGTMYTDGSVKRCPCPTLVDTDCPAHGENTITRTLHGSQPDIKYYTTTEAEFLQMTDRTSFPLL